MLFRVSYLSVFDSLASSVLRYFSFFDMQITHMSRSIRAMTYWRMLIAIIKRYMYYKTIYMFGVVGETHAHDYFEVISFFKYITFSDMSLHV